MAADTAAKRYSAMNIASPWRGLNVVPDVTIPAGQRAAAMFLYFGFGGTPPPTPSGDDLGKVRVGIIRGGYVSDGSRGVGIGGLF